VAVVHFEVVGFQQHCILLISLFDKHDEQVESDVQVSLEDGEVAARQAVEAPLEQDGEETQAAFGFETEDCQQHPDCARHCEQDARVLHEVVEVGVGDELEQPADCEHCPVDDTAVH